MRHHTSDKRHIISRIVVFLLLLSLTTGVLILLGSPVIRQKLKAFGYQYQLLKGLVEEKFHNYNLTPSEISQNNTRTIPVLLYHGIGDDKSVYTLSQDQFRTQMIALKNAGYHTIDVDTFVSYMKGDISLPEKSILITFDDGRKDSYYGADPILAQLGFHAVMFVAVQQSLSTQAVDSTYYLNTKEVKQMISSGRWDIESHAMQTDGGLIPINASGKQGYFLSNKMWLADKKRLETDQEYDTRVVYELTESKKEIQSLTGKKNILISYPFGDFGNQSINNKANAENLIANTVAQNYAYAFRQLSRPDNGFSANSTLDNPYLLRRIEMRKNIPDGYLLTILANSSDFSFVKETITGSTISNLFFRWHSLWGTSPKLKDNSMVFTTDTDNPSSVATFDGSRDWSNYMFTIHTPVEYSGPIALFARLSDSTDTGVRCTWVGDTVRIQEAADDTDEKNIYNIGHPYGTNATLGIAVNGNLVGCYENNHLVAGMAMKYTQKNGGIGVQIWENDNKPTNLSIDSFSFFPTNLNLAQLAAIKKYVPKALVQPVDISTLIHSLSSFALTPRYATGVSIISTSPDAFEQNPYGAINATYDVTKGGYTITVGDIRPNTSSGADYLWPPMGVKNGQEYSVEGSYSSTTPTALGAKFVTDDGHVTWVLIKTLPVANTLTAFKYTVMVPKDATMMHLYQSVQSIGSLTTLSPKLFLLKDGKFNEGMVTLNFDDGRKTFIDNAFPLLEKYHMVASLPIITSATGWSGYMNPADLYKVWQAGNEITAHTRDHVHLGADMSNDDIIKEIVGSWYDLQQAGFPTDTFVYPYGDFSSEAEKVASQSFLGARSVIRGFNTRNTDPYALEDQLVDSTVTQQQIQQWVSDAQTNHTWLILEMHNVNTAPVASDVEGITTSQLDTLLQVIKNSGIKVVTLHDGLLDLRAR